MIRKFASIVLSITLFLTACGQKAPTWQEQYDLGMRYLEEGNYEEAIIAFTAAIEIDPKQAPAYVGRGDTYVLLAQTISGDVTDADLLDDEAKSAYQNAIENYLMAIELGETDENLLQKAAEVYIALGDLAAASALVRGDEAFKQNIVIASTGAYSGGVAAIKTDGSLWAWGDIYGMQMSYPAIPNPTQIMTDVSSVFGWNASTDGHSGVPSVYTAILKTDSTLWLLGDKPYPFLEGSGDKPVKVMDQVAAASAGEDSLAILKMDGSLWIYDFNETGKVMDGVAAVSSCGASIAAIKKDGSLWMWGDNTYGQLGIGNKDRQNTPVKVMDGVVSVDVCHTHTAAIKTDGSLWMWGDNSYGQLGTGMAHNDSASLVGYDYNNDNWEPKEITVHFSIQTTPVKVMDQVALVSVNGGSGHSTHAIRTDGSLWCWGNNKNGQLGNGGVGTKEVSVPHVHNDGSASYSTYVIQDVPANVMDDVVAVNGNFGTTAVVKREGTLWITDENTKVFTQAMDLNPIDVSENLFEDYIGSWTQYEEENAAMQITDVTGTQILCSVAFYRLASYDFTGTIDAKDHAALYDGTSGIYGELVLDGEQVILILEDVPNYYFDSSLSQFLGGTQFIFQRI